MPPVAKRPSVMLELSLETLLDGVISDMDDLIGEVRHGVRDQRHFETLEERGQAMARRIVQAFRGAR